MRLDCSLAQNLRTIVEVLRGSIIAICIFSGIVVAQNLGTTGPDTGYAPCLEGQVGTRYYESELLVSADGKWRAYARVEARREGEIGCSNFSTLQVQGPDETSFHIVHTIKPEPGCVGNGLKLISWSQQRHLLAVQPLYWQIGSDAGGFSLLVYDADRKRTMEPELQKLFASKYRKKECAVQLSEVLGFDSQNRVLFTIDDVIDPGDDEPVPQTRCVGGPSVWALDINTNQLDLVKRIPREGGRH